MSSIERQARDLLLLLFSLSLFHLGTPAANAVDMLDDGRRNITDGETLFSAGGSFTLGFFSPPGVATRRYLGIWFSVSEDAVCWVANRDRPLNGTSGVLLLGNAGSLLLLDGSDGEVVWSSNSTGGKSAVAQLLESGNLVVRQRPDSSAYLWQLFDHPSNTLLPGMKTGKNLWTGAEWDITSWRSASDPSPGPYRRGTETKGLPENALWQGDTKRYWTGPWNGLWFNGVPEMASYADMFTYQVTVSPGEITYGCGAFGLCNVNAASTSFCSCARGFSPASPSAWYMRETSGGCRRNAPLDCGGDAGATTDGFVVVRSVKLPDTHNASVEAGVSLKECGERCLANCSCVAYAAADIRGGGGGGHGCIMWSDYIVDLRYMDKGQDLYLRLAKSELDESSTRKITAAVIAAICVACAAATILLLLGYMIWRNFVMHHGQFKTMMKLTLK
ncbi:hypothetical protein E2562_004340 [Oryza meyeriana var. granulata]|uniref:non-specific serine/threonine protein kinase n=1 Tax=Oryza meyeriana var. granulata TaxID=110450 RepID=A0A6G1BSM2_9ORYZ|nr:hypothetical protein E2562_004340 [Oryza meyeriana var. granulata]